MTRDTWTRLIRRALRWQCPTCNRINPEITSQCLTAGCPG